jgi:hypothetical protein
MMAMAKDFIVPKDVNFCIVYKRITNDRRAYPHLKDCIGALEETHVLSISPS